MTFEDIFNAAVSFFSEGDHRWMRGSTGKKTGEPDEHRAPEYDCFCAWGFLEYSPLAGNEFASDRYGSPIYIKNLGHDAQNWIHEQEGLIDNPSLIGWNDAPGRTRLEVIDMFQRAAARAHEAGV